MLANEEAPERVSSGGRLGVSNWLTEQGDEGRGMGEGADEREGPSAEELARRTRWFEQYVEALNARSVVIEAGGGPHACPCCRYPTLDGRGHFEICFACGWEDDGQDDEDAETVRGGPNGSRSLTDARRAYAERPVSLADARRAYSERQARWECRRRRSS
ncbi:CPCC family cysteine-rich protein [Asanoa hainanensis]|uniref:CPCC family cysteine-rich protein n=1 Tax=Asanoa hainanensis TaxID=560556 RepID=UPI001FE81A7E|nr:CPCC family cysteine-rich protein [Asanoa hainanensis]